MKFTNVHNLPDTLIRAARVRNALYKSNADRSVTQLINPPQIDILRKVHFRDMQKDISEEFFGLFGSAIHQILEWAAEGQATEERLYATVAGWVISGQIDLQQTEHGMSIVDYKFCSSYALTKDDDGKPEWEQQLNIYAYLVWLNKGIRVTDISVCAIVRDWQRRMATVDLTYPQSIVTMVPLRLWSLEQQEAYVRERVALHQEAQFLYDIDEPLPECSARERWATPDKWTVVPVGMKRGKHFDTKDAATAYGETLEKGYILSVKRGKSTRCSYCQVSEWCQQYAKMQQERAGEHEQGTESGD